MLGRRFWRKGRGWTVMVYMVADEHNGVFTNTHVTKEVDAIKSAVASHPHAQIAVQADTHGEAITRYFAQNGVLVSEPIVQRPSGQKAINDFIGFGMRKHPAEHYLVVFWGHGFGPAGLRYGRFVRPKELRVGLRRGFGLLGPPIEIVTFMSCQMSVIELAYEFSEWFNFEFTRAANHIVASQGTVQPLDAFPYGELFDRLSSDAHDATAVGRDVVDILNSKSVSGESLKFGASFSLVNVGGVKDVMKAVRPLAAVIERTNPFQPDHSKLTPIEKAIHDALESAHTHDQSLLDLGRLGKGFGALAVPTPTRTERVLLDQINAHGAQLSRAIQGAFVMHRHNSADQEDTGASVFCPTHHDSRARDQAEDTLGKIPAVEFAVATNMAAYRALSFSIQTNWHKVVDKARNA